MDRAFDEDGLTCTTCHSVQKLQPTDGNGGFVMGVPAVMVDENGNRIPGEVSDEEILTHPDRHSKAVMQELLPNSGVLCSLPQSQLAHPLNDYKFIRAFTVYDEWQNSKFSQRNPLTFYTADFTTCQGCHMKRGLTATRTTAQRTARLASHRWLAGNTAVPFYYGFDEQLQKTIEFLQSRQLSERGSLRDQEVGATED